MVLILVSESAYGPELDITSISPYVDEGTIAIAVLQRFDEAMSVRGNQIVWPSEYKWCLIRWD